MLPRDQIFPNVEKNQDFEVLKKFAASAACMKTTNPMDVGLVALPWILVLLQAVLAADLITALKFHSDCRRATNFWQASKTLAW